MGRTRRTKKTNIAVAVDDTPTITINNDEDAPCQEAATVTPESKAFDTGTGNPSFIRSLTACAILDSHMSEICSTHICNTFVYSMTSNMMDEATMTCCLIFINTLVKRWLVRSCKKWQVVDHSMHAATLASITSDGQFAHTDALRVLRQNVEVMLHFDMYSVDDFVSDNLSTWMAKPGFLVVVEMLHRGAHGPSGCDEIITGVWTTSIALLIAIQVIVRPLSVNPIAFTPFMTILPGCVSLVGTLRKLIIKIRNSDHTQWEIDGRLKLGHACKLLCQLAGDLTKMHAAKLNARIRAGLTDHTDIFVFLHLAALTHVSIKCLMRTLISVHGPLCTDYIAIERKYDEHGLRALDKPEFMVDVGNRLDGRLLPSCCNPSCVLLTGISDVAMPTKLCSGCRRVRYCSQKCQKIDFDAWHGAACGKGMWSPV